MDSRLLWVELREFDGWLGEDEFIKTRFEKKKNKQKKN